MGQKLHGCWASGGCVYQDQEQSRVCFENEKEYTAPLEIETLISLSVICRASSVGRANTLSTQPFNMHIKD